MPFREYDLANVFLKKANCPSYLEIILVEPIEVFAYEFRVDKRLKMGKMEKT